MGREENQDRSHVVGFPRQRRICTRPFRGRNGRSTHQFGACDRRGGREDRRGGAPGQSGDSGHSGYQRTAALDSVFGGIKSVVQKNFDMKVFVSGFFINSITAVLLTFLGNKLNVDISLAAIIVFVGRIFIDLAIIRRYYIEKWTNWMEKKQKEKSIKKA